MAGAGAQDDPLLLVAIASAGIRAMQSYCELRVQAIGGACPEATLAICRPYLSEAVWFSLPPQWWSKAVRAARSAHSPSLFTHLEW